MQEYSPYMNDYILDIYVDKAPNHKVWLIDINPWIPNTMDTLLFSPEDIENLDSLDFRIVKDQT